MRRRPAGLSLAFRAVAVAGVAFLLFLAFQSLDFHRLSALLTSAGPGAAIVLAPYGLMLLADTTGWFMLTNLPLSARTAGGLLRIRVATEALSNSLPAGAAVAETTRAVLLGRTTGVDVSHAAGSSYLSRLCLVLAHVLFGLIGFAMLPSAGSGIFGHVSPLIASLAVGAGMLWLLAHAATGPGLASIFVQLERIRWAPLRSGVARALPFVREADMFVSRIAREHPARIGWSTFAFLLGWFSVALETHIMLRVLGVVVPAGEAVAIEAAVALARGMLVIVPGGLGTQELTYFAFFSAFGYPDAPTLAGAFTALKRARELAWISLGYAVLSAYQIGPAGSAARSTRRRAPGAGASPLEPAPENT